jgi:uncharacterized protein
MTLHRLSSSLLLAASLALPLPTAHAASFSCSKATTPAERIICGDKDLGARDSLMARLFAAALRGADRDKVRASQQSWHDTAMACVDAACVKQSYDKRIFELIATKGGRSATTEFHRGDSDRDQGSLVVAGPVDGIAAFSISATYVGKGGAAAGDVYASGANGVVRLEDGRGKIDVGQGCIVTLRRVNERSWQAAQTKSCGAQFAANISLDGLYRR